VQGGDRLPRGQHVGRRGGADDHGGGRVLVDDAVTNFLVVGEP
jgi:hypothetical protein